MNIDINGVKITLTQDQINEIARQTNKYSYNDIKTEMDILHYMNISLDNWKLKSIRDKIAIMAKCLNNNVKLDFKNRNQKKYYLYYEVASGSLVGFFGSDVHVSCAIGQVAFYISEEVALHANKYFKYMYEELISDY